MRWIRGKQSGFCHRMFGWHTMDWSFELSPTLSKAADAAALFLKKMADGRFAGLKKYVTAFPTIYSINSVV